MNNDFIKGIEMLLRCKCYVENRVEILRKHSKLLEECGRPTDVINSEIQYLLKILNNE